MITSDIYGKTFSETFDQKISSPAQFIKPKVLVNWIESKHTTGLSTSINSEHQHASTSVGSLGYYFTAEQMMNGFERQSYTWGVADAKDVDGNVIRADGSWYVMPNNLVDNYEFGWWSGAVSTASLHPTYGGYSFSVSPQVEFEFDDRKCNLIRVLTSELYGQVHTYQLEVWAKNSLGTSIADPWYNEIVTMPSSSYYYDHHLPDLLTSYSGSSQAKDTIYKVRLTILSTRNPQDYARIQEVNPIYQVDVSDDVVSFSSDKTRDLHATELPIAGSASGSVSVDFDNTGKKYSVFSSSSEYGPYMKKNVKILSSVGWQIQKTDSLYIDKLLRSSISNSDTTISITNVEDLPAGSSGNEYVVVIDPDNENREYVLVDSTDNGTNLIISQRGYNNSIARSHDAGAVVRFESFEYIPYTESYVDEWSSSTSSMTVGASTSDWTKFASEYIINDGFFVQKATLPDAISNLLFKSNFPNKNVKALNRFERTALKSGAVLHMNFSEKVTDRSNTNLPVKNGLRLRLFVTPAGAFNKVKDITADALDRDFTDLEKALGLEPSVVPDVTLNTSELADYDGGADYAMDLIVPIDEDDVIGYPITDVNGDTSYDYFNGVADGYYTPLYSGDQVIGVSVAHGGVKVYLEDTLILDSWKEHAVSALSYTDLQSEVVNLVAGKPYKIRVEFFYTQSTNNSDGFAMYLQYGISSGGYVLNYMPLDTVYTMSAIDRVGGKDASYTLGDEDCNKTRNNGVYIGEAEIGKDGGLVSNPENYSVRFTSDKYMRLPYDLSWDLNDSASENYTGEWSIELNVKPTSSGYSVDGEYLSMFDSATPTGGFEFFNTSSSNGFKIKTSDSVETISASSPLTAWEWNHIVVTFDGSSVKYYLNGAEQDSLSLAGSVSSWDNLDIGFGGRNAYYSIGVGEVAPTNLRDFFCDQFLMYRSCLTAEQITDRYTEIKMQPLTVYPYLYGNEASVKDIIDEISLADLGRFYIDELGYARYEHFYRFFENSIDQHANVQLEISDDNHIISADYNVNLQANKVVVKVAEISSDRAGVQGLWRAESPTTLAVINLETAMTADATAMNVSTTTDPPFVSAGYVMVDNEIIKYSGKTPTSFTGLQRGALDTVATTHSADSKVREIRYWDFQYDKAPAFNVRDPLISGVQFESPQTIELVRFEAGSYGAKLILAPHGDLPLGSVVFVEGTNPLTQKVSFAAIAGIPVALTDRGSKIEEQSAELSENIRLYGLKEVVIENRFITDFGHAQKIADFIISKMSEPVPILNVETIITPKVQVGDRIKITDLDAFDIINGEYWVVSKNYTFSSSPSQTMMLRKVV